MFNISIIHLFCPRFFAEILTEVASYFAFFVDTSIIFTVTCANLLNFKVGDIFVNLVKLKEQISEKTYEKLPVLKFRQWLPVLFIERDVRSHTFSYMSRKQGILSQKYKFLLI